ncbi:MAG: hypothetical protein PVSMB7_30340 [Chloroflexota bacterium]
MLLGALAYAFLVYLFDSPYDLLRTWFHRTGKRSRDTPTPLYRLRSAVSRLWLAYPSHSPVLGNSG